MARFEIEGPNGERFEVEAPDAQSAAAAVREMFQRQEASAPDVPADIGRGFMSGLLRGAASTADVPGSFTGWLGAQSGRLVEPVYEFFGGEDLPTEFYTEMARQSIERMSPFTPGGMTWTGMAEEAAPGAMAYQPQTTAGEYARTFGEMLPGAAITPGGIINRLMYGAVAPTVGAELGERGVEALGGGETGQTIGRISGAILGPSLLAGGSRIVSPYGGTSPVRLERADLLEQAGIPVTAGQRVGAPGLQVLEDSLSASPDQLEGFTSAVVRSFGGQPGDDIGAVLRTEERRIGDVFDDVATRLRVDPTITSPASNPSEIVTRLEDIATEWGRGVQSGAHIGLIDDFVEYFDDAISGGRQITPQELMRWRSQLSRTSATTTDAATSQAAAAMLRELDDVIEGSLMAFGNIEDVALLNTARQQWRDFLAFETAATRAGEAPLEGAISPQALAQALRQQGGTQYVAGERGDFGNLARAGEQILRTSPAVSPGGVRAIPEVAAGQAGETMATIGGGGGLSAALSLLPRTLTAARRGLAQDPLGQMYLQNQMLGAPEYLPFSARTLIYGPLSQLSPQP